MIRDLRLICLFYFCVFSCDIIKDFNFCIVLICYCKINCYCLHCSTSPRMLEYQIRNCLAINNTKSVLLPEGSTYVNFQNFKRIIKAPCIIYSGFKCVLISSADKSDDGPNTGKYLNHIVCCMAVN